MKKIDFNRTAKPISHKLAFEKDIAKEKGAHIPKQALDYDYEDEATFENDRNFEVSETLAKFKEGVKMEQDKRADNTCEDFYSCIVFNNKRQRAAFFQALKVKCTETTDIRFINGVTLAAMLNIPLPESTSPPAGNFKVNKEILSMCINPKTQK